MNATIEVGDSVISGFMGNTDDQISACVGAHITEMMRDEVAHGVRIADLKINVTFTG